MGVGDDGIRVEHLPGRTYVPSGGFVCTEKHDITHWVQSVESKGTALETCATNYLLCL